MERNTTEFVIALLGTFLIVYITFSIVKNFIDTIIEQGAFVEISDVLSLAAILVSILSIAFTLGWNIWTHFKTSDIYQPVASIDFRGLPPYTREGEETIISIKNVGKRNLKPKDVYFKCSWESDKKDVELDEFAQYIAPEETYDFSFKFSQPIVSKVNSITLHITDENSGISWKARRMFYIPSINEMTISP